LKPNMWCWSEVCKTDPKHVKKVGFLSAIDAYSQFERATWMFGPCGQGWGLRAPVPYQLLPFNDETLIQVNAVFFWRDPDSGLEHELPAIGAAKLVAKDKRGVNLDGDALKKACTDACTKALSMLGFNADVFLGAFDSNKYTGGKR